MPGRAQSVTRLALGSHHTAQGGAPLQPHGHLGLGLPGTALSSNGRGPRLPGGPLVGEPPLLYASPWPSEGVPHCQTLAQEPASWEEASSLPSTT